MTIYVAVADFEVVYEVTDGVIAEHSGGNPLSVTRTLKETRKASATVKPSLELEPLAGVTKASVSIGELSGGRDHETSVSFKLEESGIVPTRLGDAKLIWHFDSPRGSGAFRDFERGNVAFWASIVPQERGTKFRFRVEPTVRKVYDQDKRQVSGLKAFGYLFILHRHRGTPKLGVLEAQIELP